MVRAECVLNCNSFHVAWRGVEAREYHLDSRVIERINLVGIVGGNM